MSDQQPQHSSTALLRAALEQAEEELADADLQAYAEGTADPATVRRVRKWLEVASDPSEFCAVFENISDEDVRKLRERLDESEQATLTAALASKRPSVAKVGPRRDRERRRPRWKQRSFVMVAGGALAAASVAAVVLLTTISAQVPSPSGLGELKLGGQVALVRGDSADESRLARYTRQSALELELHQAPSNEESVATRAFVFRVDSSRKLSAVRARIDRREEDGRVSFRIQGRASELLGPTPGRKRLVVLVGTQHADLSGLDGLFESEACGRSGITCRTAEVEYLASRAGADRARLYRHAWLRGVGDELISGFDRLHLPVVHVYGSSLEDWSLQFRSRDAVSVLRVAAAEGANGPLLRVLGINAPYGRGQLELLSGDGNLVQAWPIEWSQAVDDLEGLAEPIRLRRAGRFEQAGVALKRALVSQSGWVRLWARVELGKSAFHRAQMSDAHEAWREAADEARQLHIYSELASRLRSLAWLDMEAGDFAEAQDYLDQAYAIDSRTNNEAGLARDEYYLALLFERRGAPRSHLEAKRRYRSALASAERRGHLYDQQVFALLLARLLAEGGAHDEAVDLLDEYHPPAEKPGAMYLQYRLARRTIRLEKLQSQEAVPELWKSEFHRSKDLLELARNIGSAQERVTVRTLVAHLALGAGLLDDAERQLSVTKQISGDLDHETRWANRLVEAQVAMRRGDLRRAESLLRAIRSVVRSSNAGLDTDVSVVAATLIGDVARLSGRVEDAKRSYREALQAANEVSRRFSAPDIRGSYRTRRSQAAAALVSLLIDDGEVERAFIVVQRMRAQGLYEVAQQSSLVEGSKVWRVYLEERETFGRTYPQGCRDDAVTLRVALPPPSSSAWRVPGRARQEKCRKAARRVEAALDAVHRSTWPREPHRDQLPGASPLELASDEALLALFRLGPGRWASFFVRDKEVAVVVSSEPLEAWKSSIRKVRRLYVDDGGYPPAFDLGHSDFLRRAAVVSTLVPGSTLVNRSRSHDRRSWTIVADPDGTLPQARLAAASIASTHPSVALLEGAEATRKSVLTAWKHSSFFQFSGHANIIGENPWRSQLRLSQGAVLTVQDVFAAPDVPEVVVLAGCQAGPQVAPGVIGLPQAFLHKGANVVIAAVEVISDEKARRFVEAFHSVGGPKDPVNAFHAVLLSDPETAKPFRIWGG